MATINGTAGNDSWTVVNPGTFTLDGLGGTDTLHLGTSLRSTYRITQGGDGSVHIDSVSSASGGGLHATLFNVEVLTFNSGRDTVDLRTYFGGGGGGTGGDTTAPTLVSASPADEATAVAVAASIVLTFSEAIQRGSGSIVIRDASGATVASYDAATSGNLGFNGSTLTIDPGSAFVHGSALSVEIGAGAVKDTAGNAFAGLASYNFSTTDALAGTAGNDTLSLPPGVARVDGGAGLDTVVLPSPSGSYRLSTTPTGFALDNGSVLRLDAVERLQFSNQKLALDLAGNAGQVARILGAVFGAAAVHDANYAGIGLQYRDGGMGYEALMQLALTARLGSAPSHADVVTLLYTNVVGSAPGAPELAAFTALLDNQTHTPASLGVLAADTPLNAEHIDLVGLQSTGLIYT
jgi:hypothetical protein